MPSRQSNSDAVLWSVTVTVAPASMEAFERAFADLTEVVSLYEAKPDGSLWSVQALFRELPPREIIAARVALAAHAAAVPEPAIVTARVASRDWLTESVASFKPLTAGRFYVHGDHVKQSPPPGKIPLRINAATAFGSGEHATTYGCLLALDALCRRRLKRAGRFAALDLGCGSGILALAMAKAWRRPVLAADVDPEAVRVTRANARINGVGGLVRVVLSESCDAAAVPAGGPYAVITANILARPLALMAATLSRLLAAGGFLILSGLLIRQEAMVLAAYRAQGLRLHRRVRRDGWATLVLRR